MEDSLILMAKNQNEDAFLKLFYHFHPIYLAVKRKYCYIADFEEQDWLQEALIILNNCLRNYSGEEEKILSNIFKRALENKAISLLRKEKTDKRRVVRYSYPFGQEKDRCKKTTSLQAYTDDPLEQLLVSETLEESTELFSKLERKAFCKYYFDDEISHSMSLRRGYDRSKRKITECLKSCNPHYQSKYPPFQQ